MLPEILFEIMKRVEDHHWPSRRVPVFVEVGGRLLWMCSSSLINGGTSHFLLALKRSDFLGTSFTIYDGEPPYSGAKPSCNRGSSRFASKQICPQDGAGNYEVGQLSYKFNLLKFRGPRRMVCSLKCPWSAESHVGKSDGDKTNSADLNALSLTVLKNKAPRWHEHLQCWCLNFHGRVTVASVKNFQLAATLDQSHPGGIGDEETVLLQFGKVGDDLFTMDFRQPLSAFQAFAISLTSFGTKLACE
ncbi:hypothetical protein Leryth_023561 [Lithospermum erythrorhizon]|nr:hypothetical protein Leryth_023561 [Lithospermum erythrorhizon]